MSPNSVPLAWTCRNRSRSVALRFASILNVLILLFSLVGCAGFSSSKGANSHTSTTPLSLSAKLSGAIVGAAYNESVSATGGVAPYTFAIGSGSIPPGLIFSSNGTISGTPKSTGTFTFTVFAADGSGLSPASTQITLPVTQGQLAVSPASAAVTSSGTQQFQALLNNVSVSEVTWTASQGTISSAGVFTAPKVTATTSVTITANRPSYGQTASANVTVSPAGTIGVSVSPSSATVTSRGTQQFTATVINTSNTAVTWSASQGTISAAGLFTAPSVTQNTSVSVTATSVADPTKSATSSVTVTPALQVSISISPTSATVSSSGSVQFSATVSNTSNTAVTWSASLGTITSGGFFTAPSVTSTKSGTVTATSVADPTKSASASVTVTPPVVAPLLITTVSLPSATGNAPYLANLAATGGTLPYAWSLASGQLPAGLNLSQSGVISGVTTPVGQYNFTVKVTDASSPVKSATQPLTLVVNSSALGSGLSISFFGMHMNHPSTPWPSVPIGSQRIWDADNASWSLTNTAPGVYDWTAIDERLSDAQIHGTDVLYDLGRTPVWAQCGASTSSPCTQTAGCGYSSDPWGGGPGQCYWPADLNTDGTGTNQHWKDWVTAIATHSVNSSSAHIKYYEIWNEPNDDHFFRGTTAQLVRMAQDAACIIKGVGTGCKNTAIDPSALIVTPAPTEGSGGINDFFNGFFGGGGTQAVDVIAFHGYNGTSPEKVASLVSAVKSGSLATYNQNGKPLFDTEYSWGLNNPIADPDQQAGFVARSMILHWSSGVNRVYWYSWDTSGMMWTPTQSAGCTTPDPSGSGYTCESAQGLSAVEDWTLGASIDQTCAAIGTVWTCGITKDGGYQGLVVWDTAQTCNGGSCTTSSFTIPVGATKYVQYRDLSGHVSSVTGSSVRVGYKPILLENQ